MSNTPPPPPPPPDQVEHGRLVPRIKLELEHMPYGFRSLQSEGRELFRFLAPGPLSRDEWTAVFDHLVSIAEEQHPPPDGKR